VKLTVADLAVGDGKAKIRNTLALPKLNVGDLVLEAEAKEGVMKVTKLGSAGKDLELVADGKITLRDQPLDSLTDLYIKFKFSDAYRGKNDITKGLFGAPGSSAPALFELDPKVKQSKRADGFYGWHMVGPLTSARFDPYSAATPGGTTPPPKGASPVRGFTQ
jgi:hypothetical protein